MQGAIRSLCIASAAIAACALVSNEAEAKGCSDHILTKVYSNQNRPSEIPKTRRSVSRRKKNVPLAQARPMVKPAMAQPVVKLRAVERPYEPASLEELDIDWVDVEFLTDDPRGKAIPQLIYNRFVLGAAYEGSASSIAPARVIARPAFLTPLPLRI